MPFVIVIKAIKRVVGGRELVGLEIAVHQQITGRPGILIRLGALKHNLRGKQVGDILEPDRTAALHFIENAVIGKIIKHGLLVPVMLGGQHQIILPYIKVRNGHLAAAIHKAVRPRAAGQGIRAAAAVKGVIAGPAVKSVIAGPAVEDIIARAAVQNVITGPAVQNIIVGPAIEGVVVGPAVEGVIAGPAVEGVIASPAVKRVIAAPAVQFIIAALADQPVVAAAAEKLVVALAALQIIVAAKAPHIGFDIRVGEVLFGAGVERVVVTSARQKDLSGAADGGQIPALIKTPAEVTVKDKGLAFLDPQRVQLLDGGRVAGVFGIKIFAAVQAIFVVVAGDMKTAVDNLFAQLLANRHRCQAGAALLFQAIDKIIVKPDLGDLAA